MIRWLVALAALCGSTIPAAGQVATADRIAGSAWWPTSRSTSRADYIGAGECLRCHPSFAAQLTTPMAGTLRRASASTALQRTPPLTFQQGPYAYALAGDGARARYTVTGGAETRSALLDWAFGAGRIGQTYLFDLDGRLQEARVSYFGSVDRLGLTPARSRVPPRDLADAMARPVGESEARRCFACHTTVSSTREGFDPQAVTPGVTCEACHGPGRAHRDAATAGTVRGGGTILNPAGLSAPDSVDFCGACHATFWDVTLANERGLAALRSQPFRLQSSRCWQQGDDRLTCVACHNPHVPLARDQASYDRNCLACHGAADTTRSATRPPGACPVGQTGCAGCHMPKYDVPEMRVQFTDHRIRVVGGAR